MNIILNSRLSLELGNVALHLDLLQQRQQTRDPHLVPLSVSDFRARTDNTEQAVGLMFHELVGCVPV